MSKEQTSTVYAKQNLMHNHAAGLKVEGLLDHLTTLNASDLNKAINPCDKRMAV